MKFSLSSSDSRSERNALRRRLLGRVLAAPLLAFLVLALNCSGGTEEAAGRGGGHNGSNGGGDNTDLDGGGPGGSATPSQGGGGAAGINFTPTMSDGASKPPPDANCAEERRGAETIPLDIYVMYDQSASMNCAAGDPDAGGQTGTRWDSVNKAFLSFINSPQAKGIGIGIGYFGQPGMGLLGPDPLNPLCNASDYEKPDVEIDLLPKNAMKIQSSLNSHMPSTTTPSQPALQGAIAHAQAWATAHPSHIVIVLLVTDGQPNGCMSTVQGVADAAAAGLTGMPKIPTYVIGITSPGVTCMVDPMPPTATDLDTVAKAGGTDKALLIDVNTDPITQLLNTLNSIRASVVLPCSYTIPVPQDDAGKVDFNKVNVDYTPGDGSGVQHLGFANDVSLCAGNTGWYYDDNNAPTKINLCQATCDQVSADMSGTVNIVLNCPRVPIGPPH